MPAFRAGDAEGARGGEVCLDRFASAEQIDRHFREVAGALGRNQDHPRIQHSSPTLHSVRDWRLGVCFQRLIQGFGTM
jgi:hypothetical protein